MVKRRLNAVQWARSKAATSIANAWADRCEHTDYPPCRRCLSNAVDDAMNTTAKWTWALASEIVRAELERIRHLGRAQQPPSIDLLEGIIRALDYEQSQGH